MGWGQLEPLVRFQQITPKADGADAANIIDAQLGYVIDSHRARMHLGYRTSTIGDSAYQQAFLGVQILR